MLNVKGHGVLTDLELICNLLLEHPLTHQPEHFQLTWGKIMFCSRLILLTTESLNHMLRDRRISSVPSPLDSS